MAFCRVIFGCGLLSSNTQILTLLLGNSDKMRSTQKDGRRLTSVIRIDHEDNDNGFVTKKFDYSYSALEKQMNDGY